MANSEPKGSPLKFIAVRQNNGTYLITEKQLLEGLSDPDGNVIKVFQGSVFVDSSLGTLTEPEQKGGDWTFIPEKNFFGDVPIAYVVTDSKGGLLETEVEFTVEEPAIKLIDMPGNPVLVSSVPSQNTLNVQTNNDIELTFNESVTAGNGIITIFNLTKNAGRDISVTDTSQITFSENKMLINPSADITAGCEFEVRFSSGVVLDSTGNSFVGLSARELQFTTVGNTPVNVGAPILLNTLPASGNSLSQGYNTKFTHKKWADNYDSRWAADFSTTGNAIAVANGVVTAINNLSKTNNNGKYLAEGNNITVRHEVDGNVFFATYAHLKSFGNAAGTKNTLQVNDPITLGDSLGIIGGSGYGKQEYFGTHLHFQVSSGAGSYGMAGALTNRSPTYFPALIRDGDDVPANIIDGTRLRSIDIIGTSAIGTNLPLPDAAERLDGTQFGERIFGLGGQDFLSGYNGNDELYGGRGNDDLKGGEGDDLLVGGENDDKLDGDAMFDFLGQNQVIKMQNRMSQNPIEKRS